MNLDAPGVDGPSIDPASLQLPPTFQVEVQFSIAPDVPHAPDRSAFQAAVGPRVQTGNTYKGVRK